MLALRLGATCKKEVCDLPEGGGALLCGALDRWITAVRYCAQGLLREDARVVRRELPNGAHRDPAGRGPATAPDPVFHDVGLRPRRLDANTEANEFRVPTEELGRPGLQTIDNALGDPRHLRAPFGRQVPGRRGTTEEPPSRKIRE